MLPVKRGYIKKKFLGILANAVTASKLATPRTIGGVSFDGSANINLAGVNTTGNQSTTGGAASLNASAIGTTCDELFKNTVVNSYSWADSYNFIDAPAAGRWMVHSIRHNNASSFYGTQLALGWSTSSSTIYQRSIYLGTWSPWVKFASTAEVIGIGQTWTNVKASRASNINYTNTTGKPIFVSVTGSSNTTMLEIYFYINDVLNWASKDDLGTGTIIKNGAGFIVPNGSTYRFYVYYGIIENWMELR